MFLSWSTAWMGGVTLRGFTLSWEKKKKNVQAEQTRHMLLSVKCEDEEKPGQATEATEVTPCSSHKSNKNAN